MNNVEKISMELKKILKQNAPVLTDVQKTRIYKILNPDIQDYIIYGIKFPLLEQIVKSIGYLININFFDLNSN